MEPRSNTGGSPTRTLLEVKIHERNLTLEEFVDFAESFARDNHEQGTLSVRHLQRLLAPTSDGRPREPRPATRRLLESIFGVPTSELLAPLTSPQQNEQVKCSDRQQCATSEPSKVTGEENESNQISSGVTGGLAALELGRKAVASDVGHETLAQLEATVDDLASRYPVVPPADLLEELVQYLEYVTVLMAKRKRLSEHRRLLVVSGWFSLLAATVHVDLGHEMAASGYLRTASSLALDAEHDELRAWCYETEAWRVLTDGHYARALDLSQAAQSLAPVGSSIEIQSISQEGRALARLGRAAEMRDALKRVHDRVSPMTRPDRSEHHYKYDPDKSVAYTATTLAWAGDPAAEGYAREVIARLNPAEDFGRWPRRVASANLDLALALLVSARFDEACDAAQKAILSGRVVPSNRWRALEVVCSAESRKIGDARELREVYNDAFNRIF